MTEPLDPQERRAVRGQLRRQRLREYLTFDSWLFRKMGALAGMTVGAGLRLLGKRAKALSLWTAIHRGNYAAWADRLVEGWLRKQIVGDRSLFARHVETLQPQPATEVFFKDPGRLIGKRILVLKSPGENEKGVIAIDYSFVFPLFLKMFDVREVARRYYLVLEPSWSGYCDLDILCYLTQNFPVFVQAYEPRDAEFLQRLGSNLVPVGISANWWVDHRVFRPLPGVARDADAIMVASWARFKRHAAFFEGLAKLRARGHRLRAILIGYRNDCTRDDIHRLARYHGVADQLEMYERISPEEVNRHHNRAKVNVIWSRREGVNRAVIEGFFAGTPGILRAGFNYGYRYPFINEQTGCFATEKELPERLLEMTRDSGRFAPRDWVLQHMSCQKATEVLESAIGARARQAGESWSGGLAVKVSHLDAMHYWDPADQQRFEKDHEFLRSVLRAGPRPA